MAFGLEQIGKFFNLLSSIFTNAGLLLVVTISFLVFILLNVLLIIAYAKLLSGIPSLINRVKRLVQKIENLVS